MTILTSFTHMASIMKAASMIMIFTVCVSLRLVAASPGPATSLQSAEKGDPLTLSDSLFRAVKAGETDRVRVLIERGAEINAKDARGWTALDYATKRNRGEIRSILLEKDARTFIKNMPAMAEGPHVMVIDSQKFEVVVLKHDHETAHSSIKRDTVRMNKLPYKMDGFLIERDDLDFDAGDAPVKSSWSGIRKTFVVGDVHGEYARVERLLKSNRVIDKKGNWNWGRGHLVFMGDIFDRGSQVTEAFWLIYRLAKQAEKSGGKVHMVLGNHEPMIFNNDLRYLADDYYSLCDNLGINYSDLFSEMTLLGYWIRQNPVMLQINGYTFIHGGISPELYRARLPADTMNRIVWQYFNNSESERNKATRSLILGSQGVTWYRGMADDGSRSTIIDDATLHGVLEFYKAAAFVIGHTEVDSITTFLDKKVIDVNIPRSKQVIEEQGLLIKGRKLVVVYESRRRRAL